MPAEQDETRSARLLLELIQGKRAAPADARWLQATATGFAWTNRGGSWNIPLVRMAAELWRSGSGDAVAWWHTLLDCQLGAKPGRGEENDPLYFFGGTEAYSNTYSGWQWASAIAVRLWALQHPAHPSSGHLLSLTAKYNEVQATLLGLGAAAGPTTSGLILSPGRSDTVRPHAHRTGRQVWWPGPSLPASGNRSTPAHLGTDERLPLYAAHTFGKLVDGPTEKRFGWTATVLRALQRHEGRQALVDWTPVSAPRVLAGIRLLTEHHFQTWNEEAIRLNFMARLGNLNTSAILFHVHYDREDRGVFGFPWLGRVRSGLGEATAEFDGRTVRARSRFGEVAHELPARAPDSHVVVGPRGLREVA